MKTANNENNLYRLFFLTITISLFSQGSNGQSGSIPTGVLYQTIATKNEVIKIGGKLDLISSPTPEPPNLYGSTNGSSGIENSVRQLYHITHFNKDDRSYGSGIFINRVDEYSDDASAGAALKDNVKSLASRLNNPSIDYNGPINGDETIYVTGTFGAGPYIANAAFFRVGKLISYIRINTREPLSANRDQVYPLEKYVAPVAKRMRDALAGKLRAAPIPSNVKKALPSNYSLQDLGEVFGPVVISPEAWASVDTSGTEQEITKILTSGGATNIGYLSIQTKSNPIVLMTGAAFPMNSKDNATKWYQKTTGGTENNLSPLPNPIVSTFNTDAGYYQLVFIKGKNVIYLDCFAEASSQERICEDSLRSVANTWYNSLP